MAASLTPSIVTPGIDSPGLLPTVAAAIRGSRAVAIGDSITAMGSTAALLNANYFNLACLLAGGRLRAARNSGVAGNTTAQMLARIQSDVIAFAPNICLILGGTNDVPTGTAAPIANIKSMVTQLAAAGITPVLCTIPPRNDGFHAAITALNGWIAAYALQQGVPLLDFYTALVDPVTGNYKAGLNADNVHPSIAGIKAMANLVVARLAPNAPIQPPYLVAAADDGATLVGNSLFLNPGSGTPTNWTPSGSSATVATVTGDASIAGNWMQINKTSAAYYQLSQGIFAGFAAGDRLALSGIVKTVAEAGGLAVTLQVQQNVSPYGVIVAPINNWICDIASGLVYMECTVPAATAALAIVLASGAGTGTAQVAQLGLFNLTAMGF